MIPLKVSAHSDNSYFLKPILLIELNSISNIGCQKIENVRSLRYSGYLTNTSCVSCVCQVAVISKRSNNKQKSFVPKKNLWRVTI